MQIRLTFIILLGTFASALPAVAEDLDGEILYMENCASCHQVAGTGYGFDIPSLIGVDRLTGDPVRLVEFVLGGSDLRDTFVTESLIPMPAFAALSDAELAALLSYAREKFADGASAITVGQVAEARVNYEELISR